MFGDVPAQIDAAVLLINYSWRTGHPAASAKNLFPLFLFLLTVLLVFTSLTADRSQEGNLSLNIHLPSVHLGIFMGFFFRV